MYPSFDGESGCGTNEIVAHLCFAIDDVDGRKAVVGLVVGTASLGFGRNWSQTHWQSVWQCCAVNITDNDDALNGR